MTSRESFWASSKENHKRRIWVWIVSVLAQLMMYVGVLTVYLSRINRRNTEGVYRTNEQYKNALYQASKDALGFQDNLLIVLIGLGFIIGMQGFSYLYDRKKVDLYHSVPVNGNRRFAVIYVNGIIIYLTSTIVSLMVGVIMAALRGAMNGSVMSVIGFGFMWNLLFFLVVYHAAVLAVMLTGNQFVSLCVACTLVVYETAVYSLVNSMQYAFFDTVSDFYVTHNPKLSAFSDYFGMTSKMKNIGDIKEMVNEILPYYGKWFILAIVILAAAWQCYRKRPSEAAGRAIAFPKIGQILKVVVVIPLSLGLGMWIHSAAYGSTMLTALSMIGGGVISCAVMEMIFDFDIKSLFRHPVSSVIAVAGTAFVFLIFKQDLFGYDAYLPQESELDSVALTADYSGLFWDEDFNYISLSQFSEEHMFLTDVEPVLTLAQKAQNENPEDMKNAIYVNVLYRLKSGGRVGRRYWIDIANPVNAEILDRIVGSQEYKEGAYQIMTDQDSYDKAVKMTYSNGAAKVAMPVADAQKLREDYVKDMEKFDFSLANTERPCGQISFRFPNRTENRLNVYESFENTIAYLKSQGAYYPLQLNPEDIEDITITNYHRELNEETGTDADLMVYNIVGVSEVPVTTEYVDEGDRAVSQTFYDQEELAQIVQVIYPSYMTYLAWHDPKEMDENYDVYVTFKKDTTYPYERGSFGIYYNFYAGQVPEFVEKATALEINNE